MTKIRDIFQIWAQMTKEKVMKSAHSSTVLNIIIGCPKFSALTWARSNPLPRLLLQCSI